MRTVSPALGFLIFLASSTPSPALAGTSAATPPTPRAATAARRWLTFEASVGLELLRVSSCGFDQECRYPTGATSAGIASALGFGIWVRKNIALSLRFAGNHGSLTFGDSNPAVSTLACGPHAQIWATDRVWGGIGLGAVFIAHDPGGKYNYANAGGLGLDLRAGYLLSVTGRNAISVSFELTPMTFISRGPPDTQIAKLMISYQYR